jgi:hypothetical protein
MENLEFEIFFAKWLQGTVNKLTASYKKYKPTYSNFLTQFGTLNHSPLKYLGNGKYEGTIKAPESWKYINAGVSGTGGKIVGKGSNKRRHKSRKGKYSFRSQGISRSGFNRIQEWMRRPPQNNAFGAILQGDKDKAGKFTRFVVVNNIKSRGIKAKPFVDDVITKGYLDKFAKDAAKMIAKNAKVNIFKSES